eukprot:CAMPEP_0172400830 /NCGR_PEP_ID=MMETSP1061-20121228/47757_1 /TAXON_ID=37318 /ORGANISM="Pseudo-nitzschia pungens, Strain cf. pungens" /LENGTH=564 /DNA_ID=CAMNT_0013134251 /DNA_START=305 /DNA_END=1999 /DNA_ORIENTATION=-
MGNCLYGDDADPAKEGANGNKGSDGKKLSANMSNSSKRSSQQKRAVHSNLMTEHNVDVYKKYSETEVLGNGSMGHVAKVILKGAGAPSTTKARTAYRNREHTSSSIRQSTVVNYALKSIQLERVSTVFVEELRNEIEILKTMDHPNIVKLHEVFSYKKQMYLILELCDGGDLYTRLPYTEKASAYITGKLLSAIKYMHDHAIVHRDLKFENIMFENNSPEAEIKVIDFGLSKKFVSNKMGYMREGVGTLYSMAPQVLQGIYTSQADMWSVGVISYMLLSSHRPFYNKKRKVMIDRIMRCDYSFEKDYWKPISSEAKDFIDHLLVIDPKIRFNAKMAQRHKWMHREFNAGDRAPNASTTERVAENLLRYKNNSALKKLALNVIAHRSSTTDIINLRKTFDQIDTANDGVITFKEFERALKDKCKYSTDDIVEMFDSIDVNQNGHIMYTEFIAATLEAQGQLDEDQISQAFDRLDIDNTGTISKGNMMDFFRDTSVTDEEIEQMLREADDDKNGQVSFDEFLAMFRSQNFNAADMIETYETESTDEADLLGIDAVIPGGRYDSGRT